MGSKKKTATGKNHNGTGHSPSRKVPPAPPSHPSSGGTHTRLDSELSSTSTQQRRPSKPFSPPAPFTTCTRIKPDRYTAILPETGECFLFNTGAFSILDQVRRKRLFARLTLLKTLKHQNLLSYAHFYESIVTDDGKPSEYIAASFPMDPSLPTLSHLIETRHNSGETISESIIWRIVAQVLLVLEYLHGNSDDEGQRLAHGYVMEDSVRYRPDTGSRIEILLEPPVLVPVSVENMSHTFEGSAATSTLAKSCSEGVEESSVEMTDSMETDTEDSREKSAHPSGLSTKAVGVGPLDDLRALGLLVFKMAVPPGMTGIPLTYSEALRGLYTSLQGHSEGPCPSATILLQLPEVRAAVQEQPTQDLQAEAKSVPSSKDDVRSDPHDIDMNGNTPLHRLVLDGGHADLEAQKRYAGRLNNQGKTALMLAVERDDLDLVRDLAPLESNRFMLGGQTALYLALQHGHDDCAAILMNYEGVDNRSPHVDEHGVTDLMRAADNADLVGTWCWLPRQRKYADRNGQTALHRGARRGDYHVCHILVEAEHGMCDKKGRTALMHYAKSSLLRAEAPNLELIKLLYEKEGNMTDSSGDTALLLAIKAENFHIAEALVPFEGPKPAEGTKLDSRLKEKPKGYTELMLATEENDAYRVFCLMQTQAGQFDASGKSALCYAALHGYADLCRLLARKEAGLQAFIHTNPDSLYESNRTALMIAAMCGNADCVRVLVQEEARITDSEQRTALMYAAMEGQKECAEILMEYEAGMNTGRNNATAYAIVHSHVDIAMTLSLVEKPPQTRYTLSRPDNTLLMEAARAGDVFGVFSLREQMGRQNKDGMTALMFACESGSSQCAIFLRDEANLHSSDGLTARALAEKHGLIEAYRYLPPVIVRDIDGNTQLHRAVISHDVERVRMFAHLHGELNNAGLTALMLTAVYGCPEATRVLVQYEAGIKTASYRVTNLVWSGVTALMIAAARGHDAVVEHLAPFEAKVSETNEGKTALIAAAALGHEKVVRILAPYESRIQKHDGWTSLMYVSAYNFVNCVEPLLGEATLTTDDGWTALMTAAKNGFVEIVRMLLPHEKRLRKRGKYPALYYAAVNGHVDCVELLLDVEYDLCKNLITNETNIRTGVSSEAQQQILAAFRRKDLGE
ncbi:Ankyrin repeat protein 1 [Giardia muris]|uniref:Ankyrin repeat protein 1 n=1 Tax=Giardia muris TaxID=5742 RepID=A0A4Z1SRD3_GIAMU|nr:Ankyrin repeat protein 1 [Giardia muris]|eukprot:TNJ28464.1 Ankyrin repeat protein 1 [Giardia muris]